MNLRLTDVRKILKINDLHHVAGKILPDLCMPELVCIKKQSSRVGFQNQRDLSRVIDIVINYAVQQRVVRVLMGSLRHKFIEFFNRE